MIKKINQIYNNLSIIKKVMIAPIIAIVFGATYLAFNYSQTNSIYTDSKKLETILIPMLEKSSQNRSNFKQITEIFTFVVSTGELEYLKNTETYIKEVENNLNWVKKNHPTSSRNIISSEELFAKYLSIASQMAERMHLGNTDIIYDEIFVETVFKASNDVKKDFDLLYKNTKKLISQENKIINEKIEFLLNNSIVVAIIFYIFLFIISLIGYYSIKDGFSKLIKNINSPVSDKSTLHEEIVNFADDEFGVLSKKFYSVVESFKELEKEKDIVENIAKKDQLTDLYNRYYFEEILEKVHTKFLSNNIKYGIVIFDIDNFKNVNDNHGHIKGDEVLQSISNLFKTIIREEDIIARWGGEEFILLIGNVDKNQLLEISEKFRLSISNMPINFIPNITASFGGSCITDSISPKELIKIADDALYEAKRLGRNRVVIN